MATEMRESDEIRSCEVHESSVPKWQCVFEIVFGFLAKSSMVVVGLVVFVLSFPESLSGIPTTKKEFLIFLLFGIIGVIGTGLLFYFHIR